jgi:hypothetical protein
MRMQRLKAVVKDGRPVMAEHTELPEGTGVVLAVVGRGHLTRRSPRDEQSELHPGLTRRWYDAPASRTPAKSSFATTLRRAFARQSRTRAACTGWSEC